MRTVDDTQRLLVGSVPVDLPALSAAAAAIAEGSLRGGIHLVNAYTLSLADEMPALADALCDDAANLPDGAPLIWWARRKGHSEAERVYGPDLMELTLDVGRVAGIRHYLYGSTPEVLSGLQTAIATRWPGADIVGAESPPFRDVTDDELDESVRYAESLGADVVWVGMGTPKQDLLAHRMAQRSDLTFVAIGAAFDFIAGTKSQAPRWVMRIGMEWFYRLVGLAVDVHANIWPSGKNLVECRNPFLPINTRVG